MNINVFSSIALGATVFFAQQALSSSDIKYPDASTAVGYLNSGGVGKKLTEGFQVPGVEHNVQVAHFSPSLKLTTKMDTGMGTHDVCEYHAVGGQKLFEISLKKTPKAASYCPSVDAATKYLTSGGVDKELTEAFQVPGVAHHVQMARFSPSLKLTTKTNTSMGTHDVCEYYISGNQKLFDISLNKVRK